MQLLLLKAKRRRHVRIHVLEECVQRRAELPLGRDQGLKNLFARQGAGRLVRLCVPPPLRLHPEPHPRDRVVQRRPGAHLIGSAVAAGVVRSGVVPPTIRHRLDQNRLLALYGKPPCFLHCRVDRPDVVAVAANREDVVAHPAHRDPVPPVLLRDRGRDRVPVVPTEEDDGTLEGRREVERPVEVALARRPVPEIAHRARLPSLQLQRVCGPGGLRELRGEGGGDRVEVELPAPVMHGHHPSAVGRLVIPRALVRDLLEGEAAPEQHTRLAVLPENHVLGKQRRRAADVGGLLAVVGHVEAEAPLPLRVV
mmetsp:Transcript_8943/g.22104  ORF Transcript_8943/g.22104 Transcript_8943/m.22104 type:complete len:310 (+) Transcript_8943:182-1111(+)